jgi:hypothetical protein
MEEGRGREAEVHQGAGSILEKSDLEKSEKEELRADGEALRRARTLERQVSAFERHWPHERRAKRTFERQCLPSTGIYLR